MCYFFLHACALRPPQKKALIGLIHAGYFISSSLFFFVRYLSGSDHRVPRITVSPEPCNERRDAIFFLRMGNPQLGDFFVGALCENSCHRQFFFRDILTLGPIDNLLNDVESFFHRVTPWRRGCSRNRITIATYKARAMLQSFVERQPGESRRHRNKQSARDPSSQVLWPKGPVNSHRNVSATMA